MKKWTEILKKRKDKKREEELPYFPHDVEVLFEPATDDGGSVSADIIFIHGLDGDRRTSWTASQSDTPWPKELLPKVISNARILTAGYNVTIISWSIISCNTIKDHAETVLSRLAAYRQDLDRTDRPIIFVAHSLGGLLCQYIMLSASSNPEVHLRNIGDNVRGIIFLGAPLNGSRIASWSEPLTRYIDHLWPTNVKTVSTLRQDSETLATLQDDFHRLLRSRSQTIETKVEIACFFEELAMPKIGIVVDRLSATIPGYTPISIHKDHEGMSKFGTLNDPDFKNLASVLRRWTYLEGFSVKGKKVEQIPIATFGVKDVTKCLRSLAYRSMDSRLETISKPHRATCEWILHTEHYKGWLDECQRHTHHGIFWIKGKAGVGKSTLLKYIHAQYREKYPDRYTLSYFFHARGNPLDKSAIGMMRSLTFQLVNEHLELQNQFMSLYLEKQKKHGSDWQWTVEQLEAFLFENLKFSRPQTFFLFVDALDECDDSEARHVVSFLEALSREALDNNVALNICLSSRHYPHITIQHNVELVLEKVVEHDKDISKYVHDELNVEDDGIKGKVLQKANGIFMWVILAVQLLNKAFDQGDLETMHREMDRIPEDLDGLFLLLLMRDNAHKADTVLMFQLVLFAKEKLSPSLLYSAVVIGNNPGNLQNFDRSKRFSKVVDRFIIDRSRGLIEKVYEEPAYLISHSRFDFDDGLDSDWKCQFIHETVNDFLLRNKRLQQLDDGLKSQSIAKCHSRIADCCFSQMMLDGLDPTSNVNQPKFKTLHLSYPFLHYTMLYGHSHMESALQNSTGSYNNKLRMTCLRRYAESEASVRRLKYLYECWNRSQMIGYHEIEVGEEAEPLYIAAQAGCLEIVRTLVDDGVDVNARGGLFGNALQAVAFDLGEKHVRALLDAGAYVNAQGGYYGNALQAAAAQGNVGGESIKILLDAGADVNAKGGYHGNALQAAAASTYVYDAERCIEILLDAGADVNAQGGRDGNAIMAALLSGVNEWSKVRLLVDAGANVAELGGRYAQPLVLALEKGRKEFSELGKLAREDLKEASDHENKLLYEFWKEGSKEAYKRSRLTSSAARTDHS